MFSDFLPIVLGPGLFGGVIAASIAAVVFFLITVVLSIIVLVTACKMCKHK